MDQPLASARRERRRARARSQLMASAMELIAENGLAELRVGDVAEHADVALGTLYAYFSSKDELVAAIVSETLTTLTDRLADIGEQREPAEAFSIGVRRFVGLAATDPGLARLLIGLPDAETMLETVVWERSERIMHRGVEAGVFRLDEPRLSLTIAVAGVFVTLQRTLNGVEGEGAPERCAVALLQMVGLPYDAAVEIAHRPIPEITPSTTKNV